MKFYFPYLFTIILYKINNQVFPQYESVIYPEEDEGGDEHYVGGVNVIGPNMSKKLTLLRKFNKLWEPPFDSVFLNNHDTDKLDMLASPL